MSQLSRFVLPVLLTFVAGLLVGLMLAPQHNSPRSGALDSDLVAWEEAMAKSRNLTAEQRTDMRVLLAYYQRQREKLFDAQRSAIEPQLSELDYRFESLIQERMLGGRFLSEGSPR